MSKRVKLQNFNDNVTSYLRNDATGARVWQLKDRDGTLIDDTDLATLRRRKYVNNVTASVTGTVTETVLDSVLIPANTFAANDWIELFAHFTRANGGAPATMTFYFKVNTTAVVAGATQLAQITMNSVQLLTPLNRVLRFKNSISSQEFYAASINIAYETITGTGISTASINFGVNQYLMVTCTLGNTGDTGSLRGWMISQF